MVVGYMPIITGITSKGNLIVCSLEYDTEIGCHTQIYMYIYTSINNTIVQQFSISCFKHFQQSLPT